jgi:hypothetical protein
VSWENKHEVLYSGHPCHSIDAFCWDAGGSSAEAGAVLGSSIRDGVGDDSHLLKQSIVWNKIMINLTDVPDVDASRSRAWGLTTTQDQWLSLYGSY